MGTDRRASTYWRATSTRVLGLVVPVYLSSVVWEHVHRHQDWPSAFGSSSAIATVLGGLYILIIPKLGGATALQLARTMGAVKIP